MVVVIFVQVFFSVCSHMSFRLLCWFEFCTGSQQTGDAATIAGPTISPQVKYLSYPQIIFLTACKLECTGRAHPACGLTPNWAGPPKKKKKLSGRAHPKKKKNFFLVRVASVEGGQRSMFQLTFGNSLRTPLI